MINNALGLIFVEHWTRMYPHIHPRFQSLVNLLSVIECTIGEKRTCDTFPYICIEVIFVDTELLIVDIHFNSLKQIWELLFDISGSTQRTNLYKILGTPLLTKIKLLPSIVNIQKCEMVTSRAKESLFGIVSMHFLIFWSEEYAITYWKHRADCHYLINAFILLWFY